MTAGTDRILLQTRYELGSRTGRSGETAHYPALDQSTGKAVRVEEFFADAIMRREADGRVAVQDGCDVQVKSLSSDFEELCAYRMRLPEECPILRPIDLFRENGTVYAVYPVENMQVLDDYLARRGTMSWLEMKKAMGPIVGLVSRLHADGVYHRGISPETILVDREGKLCLTGLSIPPARTADSEIASTLYFGYSAPEQYSSSSWQGTWTDVYSLAAVCYRMVTGTTPVEWRQRTRERPLPAPMTLAKGIPAYGSEAIVKGLCIELSERYRTPDEFWCGILAESDGGTIRYPIPDIPKRGMEPQPQPAFHAERRLPWVIVGVLAATVAIFGSMALSRHIAATYLAPPESISQPQPSEAPSESQPESLLVPDFTGGNVERILLDPLYQQLFTFDIERAYSETKNAGAVVAQTPRAGEVYRDGTAILLIVSKGSERIAMPEVAGKTYERAAVILTEAEILFDVRYTLEGDAPLGTVVSASVPAGALLSRTRETVYLTVRTDELPLEPASGPSSAAAPATE